MTTELTMLAWTLVLAIVQVFLPIAGKTRQYGMKWNAGPRDDPPPPPDKVTGRLDRAQRNLYETLPVFIGAVLIAHVADRNGPMTALGAQLFFWGRVAYVPLYAIGIPFVRSFAYLVAMVGLVMIFAAIFGIV